MFLFLRLAGFFLLPMVTAAGFGTFDAVTGTFSVTFTVDQAAQFLATNLAGYAGIFGLSRIAKANGGLT